MILHGKCICSFPLCVEVHRCSGYCRLSYRLSVHIQRVVSARGYSGRPILASACILHVPLVIVIAPYLPALESLSALLESQRLNGQRLLAYSVCHRADLRRCRTIICFVILHCESIFIPYSITCALKTRGHVDSAIDYGVPTYRPG